MVMTDPMVARPKERNRPAIRSQGMSSKLGRQAKSVIAHAEEKALAIVTAESGTAGTLATLLADAPGAGTAFHGGFVTYAKACKTALLAIPAAVIARHTAVSREIARRMAANALKASGAHVAAAITGVMGPEPDEDGNPVGLMHIAVATRDGRIRHVQIQSQETTRGANRERALAEALRLLDQALSDVPARPRPARS
jgi:nicotinamide-nucleotide amidase